ncbi:hypothetical protein ES288_D02G153000v1 [Gossypium darwinii]|uniref:Uncharacterized protein n=1 Tax=Gossypium darwinii TaxID=34276 RepID=A0A5D2DGX4_GOSDA|nr:hypothetical protein ES288_D02G153000v1 [Gossypium darwinii]TYG79622.1 hypothetical protein ES288_D02G153000v1 [Gossypium darwinii]TYG79623.1 hypothetical protein ES288_D02G153000v1 [Gossypium darwinii]TYG79624.1 hypothetical protein ES288_D02G153000v1 [Gossypium darwinii]
MEYEIEFLHTTKPFNPVLSHSPIHHLRGFFNPVHGLLVPTTFAREHIRRHVRFSTNKTKASLLQNGHPGMSSLLQR